MFSDPTVAVMAMLILCFAGMLVMFIFVVRALSAYGEEMRESFRKQQMFLADLERQFMDMTFLLRRMQGEGGGFEAGGRSTTGRVSNGMPLMREANGLMTMLDAAARNKNETDRKGENNLLPSPSISRPLVEEYDPAKDPHLFDDDFLPGENPSLSSKQQAGKSARTGTVGGKGRSSLSIKLDD